MAFVPASFEIAGYVLLAPRLLPVTPAEAAVMGAVMGAVSPAVVVPKMVRLMDEGRGTDKRIPQLILAGASLDDVFVIVLFASFLGLAQGEGLSAAAFAQIPVSILAGVALGAGVGLLAGELFRRNDKMPTGRRALAVLALALLLVAAEDRLEGIVPLSGLLAVMSMAGALKMRERPARVEGISRRFGEIWMAAEVVLFVLVGAAVDVRYTMSAGPGAAAVILGALAFRSAGVWLCLIGTKLNRRERLFCVIAYLPKATVQAAIGGVPLAMGLPCGQTVLSAAVLAILITAPLGAIGMDLADRRLLTKAE